MHDGGDPIVVFGAVHGLSEVPALKPRPLLFYRGQYNRHRTGQEHPGAWRDDLEAFLTTTTSDTGSDSGSTGGGAPDPCTGAVRGRPDRPDVGRLVDGEVDVVFQFRCDRMNWHRNVMASSHGLSAGSACTGAAKIVETAAVASAAVTS